MRKKSEKKEKSYIRLIRKTSLNHFLGGKKNPINKFQPSHCTKKRKFLFFYFYCCRIFHSIQFVKIKIKKKYISKQSQNILYCLKNAT